jgi:hypothetical protein
MRYDSSPFALVLPPLSDEATVEILDFLHELLDLFESHYGDQIHRYYDDRSQHNIVQSEPNLPTDDPPF